MINQSDSRTELKKMLLAAVIPGSFLFLAWMVFILEISLDIQLWSYGLRPRDFGQWFGILTMPFLHGGFEHIIANTASFLILGSMLFYFITMMLFQFLLVVFLKRDFYMDYCTRQYSYWGISNDLCFCWIPVYSWSSE
jgi:membrane associated rhomboid family serine protease